ncbi:hypothetical protein SAMN05421819_4173 [Bryocella elongata]|uniref:Uncharacterized protein n=1 Tax=Bryocella elongata TaxID=863522 RepID=A0A1H6C2K6_9BACT|nr:hypothetical protein SAMN05421819_4173 [Bryocella elongata]
MAANLIRGFALLVAGCAGIYAIFLREKLIDELKGVRTVNPSDFPLHIPLLLERAHRFSFAESPVRARFRRAYLAAMLAASLAALMTILVDLGLGF